MPKLVGMFDNSFDFSATVDHIAKSDCDILDDERIKDSFDELINTPYMNALIEQMKQSPFYSTNSHIDD